MSRSKKYATMFSIISAIAIIGAYACGDRSIDFPTPDKKELAAQSKSDGLESLCFKYDLPPDCDLCDHFGFYDDGVCDQWMVSDGICNHPDPDCWYSQSNDAGPMKQDIQIVPDQYPINTDVLIVPDIYPWPTIDAGSECQNVTHEGCCMDNKVVYCSKGKLIVKECQGTSLCGWSMSKLYYTCVTDDVYADPSGYFPRECHILPF